MTTAEQQIRTARALYFDRFSSAEDGKLEERDPAAPVGFITHHPAPKAELPADLSDVILLGTIVSSQAFQSQDHGSIYTETTVSAEHLFSLAANQSDPGTRLVIVHDGGALKLPGGRILKQSVSGSGNELQLNGRYVFFLKYLPTLQAYGCVKAWAISSGRAVAVASDDLARTANKTSVYNGMNESTFLDALRSLKAGAKP
jgi:hypothetical protein